MGAERSWGDEGCAGLRFKRSILSASKVAETLVLEPKPLNPKPKTLNPEPQKP